MKDKYFNTSVLQTLNEQPPAGLVSVRYAYTDFIFRLGIRLGIKAPAVRRQMVYIAHPVSGAVRKNLASVAEIVRDVYFSEPKIIPIAPYFLTCHALDDGKEEERRAGMESNFYFFRSGQVDELRLYGQTISAGMLEEIKLCHELKIPVKPMTTATQYEYYLKFKDYIKNEKDAF